MHDNKYKNPSLGTNLIDKQKFYQTKLCQLTNPDILLNLIEGEHIRRPLLCIASAIGFHHGIVCSLPHMGKWDDSNDSKDCHEDKKAKENEILDKAIVFEMTKKMVFKKQH